ncbi:HD domain-containing protein [Candidatus Pacearchaeota archaeon]|nr:HD domain-containing protein [Candidatus Pacearchaeota archaeon]
MNNQDFLKVKSRVLSKLKRLPKNLDYHGIHHTRDVIKSAERLAKMEKLDEKGTIMVKTAALFHDVGFLKQFSDNEPIGAKMAGEILPKFNYNKKDIEAISRIIMATTMPQKPKTKYEKIVCDADLDNLGRKDFFVQTERVRKEFENRGIKISKRSWYEKALKLLKGHKYWTESARKLRNKGKKINEKKIIKILKS